MARIPVGIDDIRISTVCDREIVAKFDYKGPARPFIEVIEETVSFPRRFPFECIVGKTFYKSQIEDWVKAHGGNWDSAEFLFDKITEYGGKVS